MADDLDALRPALAAWEHGRALEAVRWLARAWPSKTWRPALALLDRIATQLDRPAPADPGFDLARAAARHQLNELAGRQAGSERPAHQVRASVTAAIERIAANPRLDWLADELRTMVAPEPNRPLNVAVFGIYSAGKSSLLNALLGKDGPRLPEAMEPATARLTEIRWGEEPAITTVHRDGREETVALDRIEGVLLQGADVPEDVVRVRVHWPSELLREITLFDTPGFGSEVDRHFEETQRLIAEVDVVMWVFNATKGGSEIEGRELPHIERSAGKSIGLINQIDLVRPLHRRKPEAWRESLNGVIADLRDKLGDHIHEWHPVSARWLEDDHPESGREALAGAIRGCVAKRREIQANAARRKLDEAACLVSAWEQASADELARARRGKRGQALLRQALAKGREDWREEWMLCKAERRTEVRLPTDPAIERLAGLVLGLGDEPLSPNQRVTLARIWQALDALARVLYEPGLGATWSRLLERVVAIRHEAEATPLYWRAARAPDESEPALDAWVDALVRHGAAALASRSSLPPGALRREAPWPGEIVGLLGVTELEANIPGTGGAGADARHRATWNVVERASRDWWLPGGIRWGLALRGVMDARREGARSVLRDARAVELALRPRGDHAARLAGRATEAAGVTLDLSEVPDGVLREDLAIVFASRRSVAEVVATGRAVVRARRWAWMANQGRRAVRFTAMCGVLAVPLTLWSSDRAWLSAVLNHASVAGLQRWPAPAGATLAHVPVGEAWLGSHPEDPDADPDEPLHRFVSTAPLLVMTTEVTQGQWAAVMGDNPVASRKRRSGGRVRSLACGDLGLGDDLPVSCVDWLEVVDFANRMSEFEGLSPAYGIEGGQVRWDRGADGYRLPTEDEWEFAARAGDAGTWGAATSAEGLCAYANVRDRTTAAAHPSDAPVAPCDDGVESTGEVGTRLANRYGLHDVLGNVWEWCWPGDDDSVRAGGERPLRGGSWFNGPGDVRPANRYTVRADTRSPWVGVRLVRPFRGEDAVAILRDPWAQLDARLAGWRRGSVQMIERPDPWTPDDLEEEEARWEAPRKTAVRADEAPEERGVVTGKVCFPTGKAPAMTIYLGREGGAPIPVEVPSGATRWSTRVPVGRYVAWAWVEGGHRGGAYTEAARCAPGARCGDSLVPFDVRSAAHTPDVDLCDWFVSEHRLPRPHAQETP